MKSYYELICARSLNSEHQSTKQRPQSLLIQTAYDDAIYICLRGSFTARSYPVDSRINRPTPQCIGHHLVKQGRSMVRRRERLSVSLRRHTSLGPTVPILLKAMVVRLRTGSWHVVCSTQPSSLRSLANSH
jgi:hypothetical protein